MGFLASMGKDGKVSYSGEEYINPTHGTRRLCLRTGPGPDDVVRYGLTTDSTASSYCGMRMRISGSVAYIGRSARKVSRSSYTTSEKKITSGSWSSSLIRYKASTATIRSSSTTYSAETKPVAGGPYTGSTTYTSNVSGETKYYTSKYTSLRTTQQLAVTTSRTPSVASGVDRYFISSSYRYSITGSHVMTHDIACADVQDPWAGEADENFNI